MSTSKQCGEIERSSGEGESPPAKKYIFAIHNESNALIEQTMMYVCYLADVQEAWGDETPRRYRYYGALRDAHRQRYIDLLTLHLDSCKTSYSMPLVFYKESEVTIVIKNKRYTTGGTLQFDIDVEFEGPDASKGLFAEFLNDVRAHADSIRRRNVNRIAVYTNVSRYWEHSNDIPHKDWSSVFLPQKQKDDIREAIDMFVRGKELCERKQVRYKFNVLLKGPPGSGKTSIVEALASELRRSIYKFSACAAEMTDDAFQVLMSNIPANAILLVEDADSLFTNHRDREGGNGITFSTFINAMDGVGTKNDLVSVYTSNFPDRLDPTMLRSCRVDRVWEISGIRKECVAAMLHHWLADLPSSVTASTATSSDTAGANSGTSEHSDTPESKELIQKVCEIMTDKKLSMASLQSWICRSVLRGAVSPKDIHAKVSDLYQETSGEKELTYTR